MDTTQIFSNIDHALPIEFEFYHLGKVELLDVEFQPPDSTHPTRAIAFNLHGDLRAVLILWVSQELDEAVYSELGNVLASKIATQLNIVNQLDLMVSPPQHLTNAQAKQISSNTPVLAKRYYAHHYDSRMISLEAWVLATSTEGFGYA